MDFKHILVEKEDGVAWIRLNRPAVLNALNRGMVSELLAALEEAENVLLEGVKGAINKLKARGYKNNELGIGLLGEASTQN